MNRYCIDSSALFDMKRLFDKSGPFGDVWRVAEDLIIEGRLFAPLEVYREIKPGDGLSDWADARKSMFVPPDGEQGIALRDIRKVFPNIDRPGKTTPHADPWMIALPLSLVRADPKLKIQVIANESLKGSGSDKIPDVCKFFKIACSKLTGLFEAEGVIFRAIKKP